MSQEEIKGQMDIFDAEFEEVNEEEPHPIQGDGFVEGAVEGVGHFEEAPQEPALRCGIYIRMWENESLTFHVEGYDQNLMIMEGLMKYARNHMDNVWNEKLPVQRGEE